MLIHLRNRVVLQKTQGLRVLTSAEAIAMKTAGSLFRSERRFRAAQRLGRMGQGLLARKGADGERWVHWLPGLLGGWTRVRDLHAMPDQTFREWWDERGRC